MKFIFFIANILVFAFNENLEAKHYSIVSAGIDQEIKPGENLFITLGLSTKLTTEN